MDRRVGIGLLLILIGTFLLLQNLDVLYIPDILYSWPMILVLIGVFNAASGNWKGGLLFLGVGVFFLLNGYFHLNFRDLWPVFLILLGLMFFIRSKNRSGEIRDNFFDQITIFGGVEKQVSSQALEGGKVTSIFGGSNIDLRKSKTVNNAAVDIITVFGGCEIWVPKEWNVKVDMVSIFGGFEDKRKVESKEGKPDLRIRGFTLFGGGEVKT